MVKDARQISDRTERGVAELREQQAIVQTDAFKLEEVDGIGPSTAKKLRRAGIEKPEELARVTPNQLGQIDGIGPKKADQLAARFQYSQTRFQKPESDDIEKAREQMAERSSAERRTDRSYNAPITFDYDTWQDNPDHWDMPGVDTIPEQRRAERTKEKASRGGFDVTAGKIEGRVAGRAAGDNARVDVATSFDPVSTAAHEIGHLAEGSLGGREKVSEELFQDEAVKEEAKELAVRRRATVSSAEAIEDAYDERDIGPELFADAFAVATEEPRAARREAPNLTRELQDQTLMEFGRF